MELSSPKIKKFVVLSIFFEEKTNSEKIFFTFSTFSNFYFFYIFKTFLHFLKKSFLIFQEADYP